MNEIDKQIIATSSQTIIVDDRQNQLYEDIRDILLGARKRAVTAVNFAMVESYWKTGKRIVEEEQHGAERAEYGTALIKNLAERLTAEFGKGMDERELRKMRQFYISFQKWDTLRPELTWSHYRRLLSVETEPARMWYMNEAALSAWSTRQLDRQIATDYYGRLLASRDQAPVIAEANEKLQQLMPENFLHDPYVLEFLDLKDYPALRESDIESALIDHLQQFLLELGRGFCFVARQKRMRFEDEDFYIDLVFYHSILKCHVLIDLKLGKLTHQDVGQMDSYIRMYDALYRNPDDNPTLGIILCSQKNEAIVKYSLLNDNKQIFASKYKLYLPTEDELKTLLNNLEEE